LLVIGVSDEQEGQIEKTFINDLGAKYPMAKIKVSATQAYGIKFYPSIYCFAPDGTVHSVPDDRMPSEAVITDLLESVSLAPKLPSGPQFGAVKSMWEKKQHKKLRVYLEKMLAQPKLSDQLRVVYELQQAELMKRAKKQLDRISKAGQGPDYGGAKIKLQKIQKEWSGFDAADAAKKELARFSKDSAIKKEISASKAYSKLLGKYDPSKISQARKLRLALRKFAVKYEGTYAGQQAEKKVSSIR
jgi:hypothetical protein